MKRIASLALLALACCVSFAATAAPSLEQTHMKKPAETGNLAALTEPAHNAQASEMNSLNATGGLHPLWHELGDAARVDPMSRAASILTSDLTQDTLQPALQLVAATGSVTRGNGAFQSVVLSLKGSYVPDTTGASIADLAAASVAT